jgi:uncharacterized protein YqgV (UPF0045/DUF77 family)
MPGYERAEISAELTVVPSEHAEKPPREQVEVAKTVAGETGLAHEAGPESLVLAGGRREVIEATMEVIEASLDAGASAVEIKVEAEGNTPRFGGETGD